MTVVDLLNTLEHLSLDGKSPRDSYISGFEAVVVDCDGDEYGVEEIKRDTEHGLVEFKIAGPVSSERPVIDSLNDALQDAINVIERMEDAMRFLEQTRVLDTLSKTDRQAFETYEVDPVSLSNEARSLGAELLR
jgi:hypothetical protein